MTKSHLSARNDLGHATDWWFAYKLPHSARGPATAHPQPKPSTGYEYLYLDADHRGPLGLSEHTLDKGTGAIHHTLEPLYTAAKGAHENDRLGWIFYNDEIPETRTNDGRKGHTKGVIGFDLGSDSAFWLLHSTPRYPHPENPDFPADEVIYGQTYLCITLEGVDAARALAAIMAHQQEPQTYGCRIPDALAANDPLRLLAASVNPNMTDAPVDHPFKSKAGYPFRLLAKNRHWDKDFWIDWVGPRLGVDLDVETWRRGTLPSTKDSDGKDKTIDVLYVDLSPLGVPYEWHYTKDHAKWATSVEHAWVCVGDINRQTSQERRGGGVICFQHEHLHAGLAQIAKLVR